MNYKRLPDTFQAKGRAATKVIPLPKTAVFNRRFEIRKLSEEEFIEHHASGTLRKNKTLGMNVKSHYLHERVAYEFGYHFECLPERFVSWGEARSEGDCKAITEAGWHIERYANICLFPGDKIECKHINVTDENITREGIGIVVRETSAPWIPRGYIVFAIITEYSEFEDKYKDAINPCLIIYS